MCESMSGSDGGRCLNTSGVATEKAQSSSLVLIQTVMADLVVIK